MSKEEFTQGELRLMTCEDILSLIPQNLVVEEWSEKLKMNITKAIVSFHIGKIIDGSFYFEYRENHRDKLLSEQYIAYSKWYVKDFKQGLIDCFLWRQQQTIDWKINNSPLNITQ